jgi:hypothetical protein
MRVKRIGIASSIVLLAAVAAFADSKPKNVYKLTHLSTSEAIVTCQNGADPTIRKVSANALLVSCGASLKATWDGKRFTCPQGMFVWADESEAVAGKDDFAYCGTYPLNK